MVLLELVLVSIVVYGRYASNLLARKKLRLLEDGCVDHAGHTDLA